MFELEENTNFGANIKVIGMVVAAVMPYKR